MWYLQHKDCTTKFSKVTKKHCHLSLIFGTCLVTFYCCHKTSWTRQCIEKWFIWTYGSRWVRMHHGREPREQEAAMGTGRAEISHLKLWDGSRESTHGAALVFDAIKPSPSDNLPPPKVTPFKSTQTVHGTRDQVFRNEPLGNIYIQTTSGFYWTSMATNF